MSLVFPPLYAIIDAALLKTSELSFAEMMAESGVELLQYRNKRASTPAAFEMSNRLPIDFRALSASGRSAPGSCVSSSTTAPDIALLVDAGGVHVGKRTWAWKRRAASWARTAG